MIHYGDIKQIRGDEIPTVDCVIGGSPCFVAGTLVQTDRGLIPIEDVKEGDKVLTHTGSYKNVEKTGNRDVDSVFRVRMMGSIDVITTANHPFYTRVLERKGQLSEPRWVQAMDLTKECYVGIPINKKKHKCNEFD